MVFHMILVSVYATLLSSKELDSLPKQKKFQIEMVTRKAKPVKRVEVKKNRILEQKMPAPVKIKKASVLYKPQKLRKMEIATPPAAQRVAVKKPMVLEKTIPVLKKSFQMARVDISAHAVSPQPRVMKNSQATKTIIPRILRSSNSKAKSADISPLPRPVRNARVSSKVSGKETRVHESAAGFALHLPKPKAASVARLSSSEGRAAVIHKSRKAVANNLPLAKKRAVANTIKSDRKSAVEFFETRIHTVSTFSSPRKSRVIPPSFITSGNNQKKGFVQKGVMIASANFPVPRPIPDLVDTNAMKRYLGKLQYLVVSAKKYPESARKQGQEGKVTVRFTVMKNGNVKNIQLVSKTNYRDLDREAIQAVKRAAPFSSFPDEIGKPFLNIVLPFKFQLNE